MNIAEELHFLRNELSQLNDTLLVIAHNQLQTVAAPTFTFASETNKLTISSATSGADIHYTTDGTTPTVESTKYTSPIDITAQTTVKAFAVKLDMHDSEVASGTFTPVPPEPEPEE